MKNDFLSYIFLKIMNEIEKEKVYIKNFKLKKVLNR